MLIIHMDIDSKGTWTKAHLCVVFCRIQLPFLSSSAEQEECKSGTTYRQGEGCHMRTTGMSHSVLESKGKRGTGGLQEGYKRKVKMTTRVAQEGYGGRRWPLRCHKRGTGGR